jgi:hypothetical protein
MMYRDLIEAEITGNPDLANEKIKELYQSADERAAFMASINPYWDETRWKNLLYTFIADSLNEITSFLVGDPKNIDEFDRLLQREENSAVLRSVSARHHLEPLSEDETRCYIEHRLKVAGRESPLFTPEAVREVHRLTRGTPRLINILCDHALLYGYGAETDSISAELVRDCSRDLTVALDIEDVPDGDKLVPAVEEAVPAGSSAAVAPVTGRPRPIGWLIGALLLAAAAMMLFWRYG